MATELADLPSAFAAGTTVCYRRSYSDYPASAGWTLTLYLAGAIALAAEAVADGDDFVVTIDAEDSADLTPGVYKWAERVENAGGEIYQVASGTLTVTADLSVATDGSEQEWLEPAIATIKAALKAQAGLPIISYQLAGRAVVREKRIDVLKTLSEYEARLARIVNPERVLRPIPVSFVPPGFEQ